MNMRENFEGELRRTKPPFFSFERVFAPLINTYLARLNRGLERGSITGRLPGGTPVFYGGRTSGFDAVIHLHSWRGLLRVAMHGSVGWYQGWEAGEWDTPDLVAAVGVLSENAQSLGRVGRAKGPFRLMARFFHWLNRNSKAGAARNIAAHYDLGNDFYAAWLDPSMTYSAGIWADGDDLEAAQHRKMEAIMARVAGAKSVLEMGCGWGAMAGNLAAGGADVTAISLSSSQLEWASANHPEVDFRLQDYRDITGQYDAIVCVEMAEALGREHWPIFLDKLSQSLKPGGRAALQYITMAESLYETYAASADFIQTYIFPGGILINESEFRKLAEARGLLWQDQVSFAPDYARTLAAWRENFSKAAVEGRLPSQFDRKFQRLWHFYLCYCEGGFRGGTIDVHQVTLIRE